MENYSREASGFRKLEKKSICLLESFSSWLSLVIWVEKLSLSDSEMICRFLLQRILTPGSTTSSGRSHWRGSSSAAWRTLAAMAMVVDSVGQKRGCIDSPLLEKRCGFGSHHVHIASMFCYKLSVSRYWFLRLVPMYALPLSR